MQVLFELNSSFKTKHLWVLFIMSLTLKNSAGLLHQDGVGAVCGMKLIMNMFAGPLTYTGGAPVG